MRHAEALQAGDPAASGAAWTRIDRQLVRQAPWIPLYNPRWLAVISARVGNYQYHPFWRVLLDQCGFAKQRWAKRRGRDLNPRRTQRPETVFEKAGLKRPDVPPTACFVNSLDTVSLDPLQRLRDLVAIQNEHSHVDAALRQRIGEIILEVENEELAETARRLVERLSAEELAQLVADWLEGQTTI
jgi:hypothetical protein